MTSTKEAYQTSRQPIMSFGMAHIPGAWPKADSQRCCIFEAVNIVGKAKYGAEWTGNELAALYWSEQPIDAEASHKIEAARVKPVSKAPPPISIARYGAVYDTPSEWSEPEKRYDQHVTARLYHNIQAMRQAAIDKEQVLWDENRQANLRLFDVSEWLALQCRDGIISSHFRFCSGGPLGPMLASDWFVENPLYHFISKGGYDRWFTTVQPAQQWPVYIFFDRDAVARAVAMFEYAPATVATTDLAILSPYLQLAVKLALANGYSSGDACDTSGVREAIVREAWDDALSGVPQSKSAVEMIAGIMGFPNIKAIEQGVRGGSKRKTG